MDTFADVLTTRQAAESLGMTHGAVRRAISDKRLTAFTIGASNRHFVTRAEVERYRQERRPPGRPRTSPTPREDKEHQ